MSPHLQEEHVQDRGLSQAHGWKSKDVGSGFVSTLAWLLDLG